MCEFKVASFLRYLQNKNGEGILPCTRSEGVYFDDNTTLNRLYFFPIGYIYISTSNTSPAEIFGGGWEKIEGRFLLSSSDSYTLLSEGGEEAHTLTVDEIPPHTHEYEMMKTGTSEGQTTSFLGSRVDNVVSQTGSTGSGASHNNMPPYLVVNMWKRIA